MEQRRIENIERKQADTEQTFDLHTGMLQELSKKLDTHTHMLIAERTDILLLQNNVATLQDDVSTLKTDVSTLKTEMRETRADITSIKATQFDHGELLREHSKRFDKVEVNIAELKATQNVQGQKLDNMHEQLTQILMLLQQKPS